MNISTLKLVSGEGDGTHTACIMSARSLLDGRPFGDSHPSQVLRKIGIRLNDGNWWADDAERTRILLPLALDERLCAAKCDTSRAAEQERARLCAEWALGTAAPMALDAAASALRGRWPDSAALLSGHTDKLRREPTRDNALAARKDAQNDAADAAAYDAAAYDAAAYAADAAADAAAYAAAAAAYAADAYAADAAAYAADAAAYDAAADAYDAAAYAADDAADAAAYAADAAARKPVRDALISLFCRLLDVDTRMGA